MLIISNMADTYIINFDELIQGPEDKVKMLESMQEASKLVFVSNNSTLTRA